MNNGHSIFDEEYRYWRIAGFTHIEAKNKAIDYYRKYTQREVNMVDLDANCLCYENDPLEKLSFNKIFEVIEREVSGKELKMVCLFIVNLGLDAELNPENYETLETICGDYVPEKDLMSGGINEIAKHLGFSPHSGSFFRCRQKVKDHLQVLINNNA